MPAIMKLSLFTLIPVAFLLFGPLSTSAQMAPEPFSAEQKKAMESLIGDYLKRNPEVILESIQLFQIRQKVAEQERAKANLIALRDELVKDQQSPAIGNADGEVTVVEFFDYRCGFCKRVLPAVRELIRTDPKLRYVFKEFPILSPESRNAARAALAAWRLDKGAYFALHVSLMGAKGALSERRIMTLAEQAGLDAGKLKQEMAAPEIEAHLEQNAVLARKLGINGTPAFVIGNQLVPGAIDMAQFKKLIAEARKG